MAKILDCKLKKSDIIKSFKEKSNSNNEGNIIFSLNSKSIKDLIINKIKLCIKNKTLLTAEEIYLNFNDTQIYFNDRLTQYNKKLLWLAKELFKSYNFKSTRTNNGGVFIRKQEREKVYKILSIGTLQQ